MDPADRVESRTRGVQRDTEVVGGFGDSSFAKIQRGIRAMPAEQHWQTAEPSELARDGPLLIPRYSFAGSPPKNSILGLSRRPLVRLRWFRPPLCCVPSRQHLFPIPISRLSIFSRPRPGSKCSATNVGGRAASKDAAVSHYI